MSAVVSVSDIQRKLMELVDEFNNSKVKVEVNWQYWLTNTIYAEVAEEHIYGQGWTVYRMISRDGIVLEVYENERGSFIRVDSIHRSSCSCGE